MAATGTWIHLPTTTPTCTGRTGEKNGHRHVHTRTDDYTHVHRSKRRKRAATGTWIHVQGPTPTCTGGTGGKGRPQARGSTSRGLHSRVQVEQKEKGGQRHVDPRPWACTHVYRSNRRIKAATGMLIHVQGHTPTCTGRTGGKGRPLARESTSSGLYPRVLVEPEEKKGHWRVDLLPGDYTHVHWSNTRKKEATGTWNYVQGPTPTYTGRTRGKGRLQAQ